MIETGSYLRFERVTSVAETERGLLAEVHGEQLRIDLVRADVVRVKISRAGVFDESPTFAVCVDPTSEKVEFSTERPAGVVRLRTSALTVSLWLDPFRLDVHRTDGSPVVETAADSDGCYWAYATLNDAFTVRRRCRREDAIYGLGEKTGRHNRMGRDFTLWNTDVLDPYTTREFTFGKPADDPRADRTSTEFDPYYVSIPFFYHQTYPAGTMAASFVDNGYRGAYEFSQAEEYRIHFSGRQYTEYIFAGPGMPEILEAYTWLTGRTAMPPLWSLGYHQSRWFKYTQEAVERLARRHRDNAIPCDALWLDIEYMDGYRVFTWDTDTFPDPAGMLDGLAEQGFRVITIIDPGVKYEPGYWVPMAMGFGVSGQAFVGADVGGFSGDSNAELYLRWMQYGALTPFCRNHSEIGNVDQYAWAWGDVIQDMVREAIRLRYRLMPYLYAAFLTASETGAPVQRPLVFDYQYDPTVRDIDDEYLLGPDLLVAPVVDTGVSARHVYLPPGSWYDWHSGDLVGGSRFLLVPTPMERIPIYARGGAVIPMWPEAPASTASYHPSAVELHLFVPEADGAHRSFLQEDDGLTLAALQGARCRTQFELTRSGGQVALRAEVEGVGYPEFARDAFHVVIHGAAPDTVRLDGIELTRTDDHFVLPNAGSGFTIAFEV